MGRSYLHDVAGLKQRRGSSQPCQELAVRIARPEDPDRIGVQSSYGAPASTVDDTELDMLARDRHLICAQLDPSNRAKGSQVDAALRADANRAQVHGAISPEAVASASAPSRVQLSLHVERSTTRTGRELELLVSWYLSYASYSSLDV